MIVDIWSDVVCPWCFIGKRQFETAIANLRAKGNTTPIEIRFRAYQLDPTAPTGSTTPAIDGYARKFGGPDQARKIIEHVSTAAAAVGIDFQMERAQRANTLLAHRALHYAFVTYGAAVQSDLKERLMKAYFIDGLNVGDIDVVADCGAECDINRDDVRAWLETRQGTEEVLDEIQSAANHDITAVPSFVINDQFLIPGSQDPSTFEILIERILSRQT